MALATLQIRSDIGIGVAAATLQWPIQSMFRLQITSPDITVWCAPAPMETRVFSEEMQIADRMATACHRTAAANCSATTGWVVEIVGEADRIYYRSPVS